MSLMGWICVTIIVAAVNLVAAVVDLQNFLSRHPTIDSPDSLADFKDLVRRQMYQALAHLALLYLAALIFLYGLIGSLWTMTQMIVLVALGGMVFVVSRMVRSLREQARSLSSADKGLQSLYSAITQIWQRKSLPDF